jgi:glycerol-3-phosphate dehydrogenase
MTTTTGYDVVVIGAGIVGSAIARELAGYQLSVALLDARDDVGEGTSKANTAILHTGFDAKPGTLESAMVSRGYHLLSDYATHTGIPIEHTGAILVAWDAEQLDALPSLKEKAEANGYRHCEIVDADAVYAQIPHLGTGALGGLTVPDESIICTWTVNLALATDAVNRGVTLLTNHRVEGVDARPGATTLHTTSGPITTGWVVNAGGLGADLIDVLFGYSRFTVTPRRGELIVYDKLARPLVNKIVLPVPTARGKGVLVSPTIYGNVMLGPTSEDLQDRTATATSEAGFKFLLDKGRKLMPRLLDEEVTATYSGLRAAIDHGDYLIEADAAQRYLLVGGIRSTGLTSGMAVAEYVREQLESAGLPLTPRAHLPAPPKMPNLGEAFPRPYQLADKIAADPAYGRIVCFCERVTEGEIRDACHSVIPPTALEGLRRRTRVMNGRCQAFFCGAEVQSLFERERDTKQPTRTPATATAAVIRECNR